MNREELNIEIVENNKYLNKLIKYKYILELGNNKMIYIKDLETFRKIIRIKKDNSLYISIFTDEILDGEEKDHNKNNDSYQLIKHLLILTHKDYLIFYNMWYDKAFIVKKDDFPKLKWKKLKMEMDVKFKPSRVAWED
jgi:hypothetical protein